MQIVFLVFMFIFGACLGSFLCCQARRLHIKQKNKLKNTKKPSKTHSPLGSRSVCLSCHTQLKWYDNIPIISWLVLKGKCRKCHSHIGLAEFLSEILGALTFLGLATTINIVTATPLEWAIFIATIILAIILGFLAIYDGLYGELPNIFLNLSVFFALIMAFFKGWTVFSLTGLTPNLIIAPLLSATVLGGLYLLLYLISKGKWVGDGDWLLGTAIGLALANPWLSLITLFITNLLACIVMYPIVKGNSKTKIHLGPFMVAAFIITLILANLNCVIISI